MYEVQDYMTLWKYSYENYIFVVNSEKMKSFTPETQQLLRDAAIEACEWGRDMVEEEDIRLIEKFRDKGVKVTELSPEELDAFKEVVAHLIEKYSNKYGAEAAKAFGIR